MKVNPETAAYCLLSTGRTKTAVLSPNMKLGVKYKVDVKNSAPPYDSLVVDAWTVQEEGELWFYFEDGNLGHNASFSFDEAKRQMLDES
jgi:hypothetical protein